MKRAWYVPPTRLPDPMNVSVFRGGDEYDQATVAVHLGPLGMGVVADPRVPRLSKDALAEATRDWLFAVTEGQEWMLAADRVCDLGLPAARRELMAVLTESAAVADGTYEYERLWDVAGSFDEQLDAAQNAQAD